MDQRSLSALVHSQSCMRYQREFLAQRLVERRHRRPKSSHQKEILSSNGLRRPRILEMY